MGQAQWVPYLAGVAALAFLVAAWTDRPWVLRVAGDRAQTKGYYPVGAVDYLHRIEFQGNVMVPFDWGSYVSWHLAPQVRVSLDSRYEVAYPPELELESHAFFMAEPGWQAVLSKYPIDLVLVPTALPLATAMTEVPGWRRVYFDGAFEIFARPGLALPSEELVARPRDGTFP
jgi:hypothetical protein